MKPLTSKQQRILNAIREFMRQENRMPTRSELAEQLGFKSANSIQQYFSVLKEKGYLELDRHKNRGVSLEGEKPMVINIPLVGTVSCGNPILAQENIEAYIPTDQRLIKNRTNKYFFLTAHGDSMDLAGIEDQDLLLVEGRTIASPGEIVVAVIGDEATVKYYKPTNGYIALVPKSKNSAHQPIILTSDFIIQGVVKKVIKQENLGV
ncbi:MAG: transcriptional repressor LexA [Patescibacteria group bacterium]